MTEAQLSSDRLDVESLDDAMELCFERGFTDGLPVVPPTPEKVAHFVEASGRKPDAVVCEYRSRNRLVSVEKVAINAVMAGCRPEYLPVVLAIIEAMGDEAFGLHAANATTGGSAVGFVVNGPIRHRLGMNFRGNVLGPGNRANSTIGRAVRLTQINAMGSVAGAGNETPSDPRPLLDRSTIGQPGKYAGYHLPENEEILPSLRPLHVERGFAPDDDVVTVFATAGHLQISVHAEPTADEITRTLSHYLVGTGRLSRRGWCVLVVPPENAEIFVRDGWSKADIREAIFRGTSRTAGWVLQHGGSLSGGLPAATPVGDETDNVAIATTPDDIHVVVAGGPAGGFVHALLPYGGLTSRRIATPHGGS